jgi:hypothetical protein
VVRFWEEVARPDSLVGPVECWALARLAASWAGEMGALAGVGVLLMEEREGKGPPVG